MRTISNIKQERIDRNKLRRLFRTNILICSTKTPQLCYKLKSSSLRSISFLLGLWYLSWRPWWWESTVNRLSFFLELLLYKIIMDSEKNTCWASFVVGVYGKNRAAFSEKPGLHNEMQFLKLLQTTTTYSYATVAARFYTYLADRCGTVGWWERWQVI